MHRSTLLLMLTATLVAPLAAAPPPESLLPGGADRWKLIWSDEFDDPDSELEEKWVSQNGPSGHILSSRWRENAKVSDGTLKLVNKKEKRGGQEWTSGSIWTKQHFQYGYYECRYRYAAAKGTNNSFWIMTRDKQPSGKKAFEIDINEGHYPSEINTNIHNHTDVTIVNGKKTHPSSSKTFNFDDGKQNFARDFHIYGLEWTEEELIFYFNGKEIRREKNDFCHQPAPVWLSLAIIGWAGKVTDAIDGTLMEVDYVRIYQARPDPDDYVRDGIYGRLPHNLHKGPETITDRIVIWWEQRHAWHKYLARCSFLLQRGHYVADLCGFRGEGVPYALRFDSARIPPSLR